MKKVLKRVSFGMLCLFLATFVGIGAVGATDVEYTQEQLRDIENAKQRTQELLKNWDKYAPQEDKLKKEFKYKEMKKNNTVYAMAGSTQVGKPYNWNFFDITTTSKFYCSQLAWRAWYNRGWILSKAPIQSYFTRKANVGGTKPLFLWGMKSIRFVYLYRGFLM